MEKHAHHHHHHAAVENGEAAEAALAELLDLDAEVLPSYLADAMGWIRGLTADRPPHRILDLGSGTGTGAFALAQTFESAEVTALDLSAGMLERVQVTARALGLTERVHPWQADLDVAFPSGLEPVDLVWASNSLHHLADPDRVLAEVFAAIRPGGLLVAAEMKTFPRFLPDDLGPGFGLPGLENRCHAVVDQGLSDEMPHRGADWAPLLTKAGFTIEAERPFVIELTPPLPTAAGRYAQASLARLRTGLEGRIDAADLATLDRLLVGAGPDSLLHRNDLTVRAARTLWAARRL
jgi:SAM-dependent methyltransferase